jgi:hypothetical protein
MIRFRAQRFLNFAYVIGSEAGTAVLGMPPLTSGPITDEQRAGLGWFASQLLAETNENKLKVSAHLTESLADLLGSVYPLEQERVSEALRSVRKALEKELLDSYLLKVDDPKVTYYHQCEELWGIGFTSFPLAQSDMIDSCRCYACDLYGGCVHHCMGVLQDGLHSLAKSLDVAFEFPLGLATWGEIVTKVDATIKNLESKSRGSRDEDLTFYSEAASHFRYLKNAWRNHVAHNRETYDDVQAHSVLGHTQDFMKHLSTRLKQIYPPSSEEVL